MRLQIVACDKCGVREEKKTVKPWTARRGSTRYQGDLCEKCFQELVDTFHLSSLARSRHQITVVDINDIPKNA